MGYRFLSTGSFVLACLLAASTAVQARLVQNGDPTQTQPVIAAPAAPPQQTQPPDDDDQAPEAPDTAKEKKEKKPKKDKQDGDDEKKPSDEIHIEATEQNKIGDVYIYTGYVDATYQNIRLQADRVEFNETTSNAIAEGNVIFDQGADQRVTARRAEINIASKLGSFYDVTGFTDRTATGEFLYYTATRVDKVSPDEYVLYEADITACEDAVPKWSFKTKVAKLRANDRVRLRNAVFDIKGKPIFWLPYASIPIDRRERKSGFLLPRFGNSNTRGFTYSQAYYQTLGRSADATIRGDYFSARGLGLGFEFRARTDERSGIRFGSYLVKDRLFGDPGPDQGGSAFFVDAVQYFPNGWLGVADVRVTSNLAFRRTFSDTFEEIINPEERSTFYLNNNFNRYSFNFLAESDSTAIQQRNPNDEQNQQELNINVRHLPTAELFAYDRPIWKDWPIYFSLDLAAEGLRRRERVDDTTTFITPNIVQRLDMQPRFTFPIPLDLGGWAITPGVALRSTFYSNGINPSALRFDPRFFTLDPNDPRLQPVLPTVGRDAFETERARLIELFDPNSPSLVTGDNVTRNYVEFTLDVRPPSFYRIFTDKDGDPKYKHVIEPYLTYRRIAGISNFERIPLFDERDAVANSNEIEYGITNRFFVRRERGSGTKQRKSERPVDYVLTGDEPESETPDASAEPDAEHEKKKKDKKEKHKNASDDTDDEKTDEKADGKSDAQSHEALSITVRQKYFVDPQFGDAFNPRRRSQFFPINTFSGFSYGGIERRFSPINVQARFRPLSAMFADIRADYDVQRNGFKDLAFTAGARSRLWSIQETYYFVRRFRAQRGRIEPGTYSGNQWITSINVGDVKNGLYGGTRLNIDFTDRIDESDPNRAISSSRLLNTRSYFGYSWDCCGVQLNYATFNLPSGLRRESQFYFTFTLAGIGSIGNENVGQPTQTRRVNRGRGGRGLQLDLPEE